MAGTAVAAALLTGCDAGPEHEDRISSFIVDANLDESGTLTVTETITYDFGLEPSAGLNRDIPIVAGDHWLIRRSLDVDVVSVESPSGAPADIEEQSVSHGLLRLSIGDSANEVTGEQTYSFTYTVDGAVTDEGGHDELYWNFIGPEWNVPISSSGITLTAPAIDDITCVSGELGESDRTCSDVDVDADSVTIAQSWFPAGHGITASVELPTGSVDVTEATHQVRPLPTWLTWSGVASLIAALGFVVLLLRIASAIDDRLVRLGRPIEVTAVSPGAAGLLARNEKIRPEHLIAMLVDLEERGVLTSRPHPDDPNEWVFEPVASHHATLTPAEDLFLSALFRDGAADLASIQNTLTVSQIGQIRAALIQELRRGGYVHQRWVQSIGIALALLLLVAVLLPLPLTGGLVPPEALTGMHIAALFIAHFSVFLALIGFLPVGLTRKGSKVRMALNALPDAHRAPPAYLFASGRSELVTVIAPDARFVSDPDFYHRWESAFSRPTRSANPSSGSGRSGSTSVGGGGGGGGGGRR